METDGIKCLQVLDLNTFEDLVQGDFAPEIVTPEHVKMCMFPPGFSRTRMAE